MRKTNTVFKNQIIESSDSYKIVMIGAGNVATHVSRHLHSSGHKLQCIYSKSGVSAKTLAAELGVPGTSNREEVPAEADFYFICVPDREVPGIASKFSDTKGIWLHTSGALPMSILQPVSDRYGVLYPLQTLSRSRPLAASQIPCLVEGSAKDVTASIMNLALSVFERVEKVNSEQRLVIHTAAVFTNNFSSHMVHIGRELLAQREVDPQLLNPLLEETFAKIRDLGTVEGRTGPAVRGDQGTMNKHIELLQDHPAWQKLYTFISRDIERTRDR